MMSGKVARGALIVVEDLDKTGKTTQCTRLVSKLVADNVKAKLLKFPARETQTGQLIDDYLQKKSDMDDHVIHLLFSANRWESVSTMKNLLHLGTTLVVDRYAYSGVAFSAAKKGLDINWCVQPDVGLPKPDAVIFLTLDANAAAKRMSYGDERYEDVSFQKNVAAVYAKLKSPDWKVVDTSDRSIEDVHAELYSIATDVIQQVAVGQTELGRLWVDDELPV